MTHPTDSRTVATVHRSALNLLNVKVKLTHAASIRSDSSRSKSSASSLAYAFSAAASGLCSNSLRSFEPRFSPGSYYTMSDGYIPATRCGTRRRLLRRGPA
eukprot:6176048-Pleurochrysis_carterae.AAC.3